MIATYKKLTDGTWGAYIELGFGSKADPTPQVGDEIVVRTKAGEKQARQVARIVKAWRGAAIVALAADKAPAAEAGREAAQAPKSASRPAGRVHGDNPADNDKPCPLCGTYCYGDCVAAEGV